MVIKMEFVSEKITSVKIHYCDQNFVFIGLNYIEYI